MAFFLVKLTMAVKNQCLLWFIKIMVHSKKAMNVIPVNIHRHLSIEQPIVLNFRNVKKTYTLYVYGHQVSIIEESTADMFP